MNIILIFDVNCTICRIFKKIVNLLDFRKKIINYSIENAISKNYFTHFSKRKVYQSFHIIYKNKIYSAELGLIVLFYYLLNGKLIMGKFNSVNLRISGLLYNSLSKTRNISCNSKINFTNKLSNKL